MTFALPESVKIYSQFGHPILMWALLATSLYALWLGFQSRKIRSADPETRKSLIQKDVKQKHYVTGSLLLALMVMGAVGGMAVTYINNGKLFVGPHLLVGLGMTALIATAGALAPWMQKGNDLARYTHIILNLTVIGLFGWQAVTGVEIVQRIVSKL